LKGRVIAVKSAERVSFYSYLIGFIAAPLGTVILLYGAKEAINKLIIAGIYGSSALTKNS
ncbi:MAG: hypothetical protein MI740_05605, partial [Halanaerobiales bacterium]|nr:hypothetical protein [Halanaerobiales bacterium]